MARSRKFDAAHAQGGALLDVEEDDAASLIAQEAKARRDAGVGKPDQAVSLLQPPRELLAVGFVEAIGARVIDELFELGAAEHGVALKGELDRQSGADRQEDLRRSRLVEAHLGLAHARLVKALFAIARAQRLDTPLELVEVEDVARRQPQDGQKLVRAQTRVAGQGDGAHA